MMHDALPAHHRAQLMESLADMETITIGTGSLLGGWRLVSRDTLGSIADCQSELSRPRRSVARTSGCVWIVVCVRWSVCMGVMVLRPRLLR